MLKRVTVICRSLTAQSVDMLLSNNLFDCLSARPKVVTGASDLACLQLSFDSDRTLTMVFMEEFQDLLVGNLQISLKRFEMATGAIRLAFLALTKRLLCHQ
jgi:hypothetical protein